MVELRLLKGTTDREPQHALIKEKLVRIITDIYKKYGYNPMETPILEFRDILTAKYAGGSEILKEIYMLTDNADRKLALRYDLTVPFCRFVGMKGPRGLRLPFKRYEIGKVFRNGPVKLGRLREFYQCDADAVGADSPMFDAECLAIIAEVLTRLGKKFYIEINNRKILWGILKQAGIEDGEKISAAVLSIDKLKKIGKEGVARELEERGIDRKTVDNIFELLYPEGRPPDNRSLIEYYAKKLDNPLAKEGLRELEDVLDYAKIMEAERFTVFRPELARGLEIYTGTIFEAFFEKSAVTSSVAAGGRYDDIIGKYMGTDRKIPAVGFTIGLDVILSDIIENPQDYPELTAEKTAVKCLVIPLVKDMKKAAECAVLLRKAGINTEVFTRIKKGINAALGYADAYGIPAAVIFGKKELEKRIFRIKDMQTGNQKEVAPERLAEEIRRIIDAQ